ncbi:hypothetical protein HDU89_001706 [Geranomyces variabilis]|nr:hypothetical protein HDU89_001706 [Geranomyces variabilis]
MGTVNILDDILGTEDDELDFDFVESKSNQPEESKPQSQPPPVSKRPSPAPTEARPKREAESEPPSLSIRKVAPSRDADVTRALDARPAARTKNAQGVTDKNGLDSAPRAAAEEKGSQQNIATPARLSADWDQRNMRTPDTLPRDTGRPPSRDLRPRDNRDVSQVNSVSSNTKGYISEPRADTLSEPRDQRTVRRGETKDRRTQDRDTGSSKGHMGEPIPLLKDANQGPHEIRPPAPSVPDKSVGPAIPLGVHPERLKAMGLVSTPPPVASPVAQRAYEFNTPREASSTTRGASITDRLGPKLPDLNDSTLSGTLKRKRHEEKGAGAADTGEKESRKRSELASDRAPGMPYAPRNDRSRRPVVDTV